jgi:hypothetical protein
MSALSGGRASPAAVRGSDHRALGTDLDLPT